MSLPLAHAVVRAIAAWCNLCPTAISLWACPFVRVRPCWPCSAVHRGCLCVRCLCAVFCCVSVQFLAPLGMVVDGGDGGGLGPPLPTRSLPTCFTPISHLHLAVLPLSEASWLLASFCCRASYARSHSLAHCTPRGTYVLVSFLLARRPS